MDEADVKSEQFGQERGAQPLPKQFVVFFKKEEDGGLASLCLIEHDVAFMRCRGVQNCHSFEQRAAPRAHCDAGSVLEC